MAIDQPQKPAGPAQPGTSTGTGATAKGRSPTSGQDSRPGSKGTNTPQGPKSLVLAQPTTRAVARPTSFSAGPQKSPGPSSGAPSPAKAPAGGARPAAGRGSSTGPSGAGLQAPAGGLTSAGRPRTGPAGGGTKRLGMAGSRGAGTTSSAGSPGSGGSGEEAARGSPGRPGSVRERHPAAHSTDSPGAGAQSRAGSNGRRPGTATTVPGAVGASASAGLATSPAQRAKNGAAGAAGKVPGADAVSEVRRRTGRVVAGGVNGYMPGSLHGVAIGAAKEFGVGVGEDALKAASKVTGGGSGAEPADNRLGAGGTSYARAAGRKDAEGVGSKVARRVALGGGAAAAPPAMAVVMMMALLSWLKSMFFAVLAMAARLGNLLWTLAINVLKAIGGLVAAPFMAFGGFVANTLGVVLGITVAATVAPVTAVASGLVATVTAAALLGSVFTGVLDSTALMDGRIASSGANCVVTAAGHGDGAQVPANTEANAKVVYSVLSSLGMAKENIAGILGNWSRESGIDPTSVESIYDEPYRIGPRKQAAWDGDFTQIPGQSHGGIGLGQWSNARTPMLLAYARSKGVAWYTIKTQLAFMLEGDAPGDVQVFKDMIKTSQGSPAAAAVHFHDGWERSADNAAMLAERTADAQMWYATMSGWKVDDSAAGGVEDIVGGIVDSVGTAITTSFGHCRQEDSGNAVPPKAGGMTRDEAQALVDLFNEEGDKFLDDRYGDSGGPGSCGSNHAMNCVSFSTYFLNKYTTFQSYPAGDGIRTAYTIAEQTGKEISSTPTPYSVGSGPGSGSAGHTLVVLGVQGDKLIVGEAGYCAFMGRIRVASASQMAAQGWKFVDMADAMLPADRIKTS